MQIYVSPDRLSSYADLDEYILNLKYSKHCYIPLSILEVALRNSIDYILNIKICDDWINDDSFLQQDSKRFRDDAKNKIIARHEHPTKSKIIAELNLGFWTTLFKEPYKKYWRTKDLKSLLPNMPKADKVIINRHQIFTELNLIRKMRNRLFHHEKIINKAEFENIDLRILTFLSYFSDELKSFAETTNQCH